MSVQCAHCGTVSPDETCRCPKCLRTTHIEAVPVPEVRPPPSRKGFAIAGIVTVAVVAAALVVHRSGARESLPAFVAATATTGPELAPLVARARAEADPLARGRLVAEAFAHRRAASVVGEADPVPHPRSPESVWRTLPLPRERLSQLDLARAVTAVLSAAGDANAGVSLLRVAPRPDEPADPTGVLGSYVVSLGDSVVEAIHGDILPLSRDRRTDLDARRLASLVAAQEAVASASDGSRDRAVRTAGESVDLWPDGEVPLAARAYVWVSAGGSSGLALADADLQAAITAHDTAPFHLARARVLALSGRVAEGAHEATRALRMTPAWGEAALAVIAFGPVLAADDAAAPAGCGLLQNARAPWTDDADALCFDGSAQPTEAIRTAAALRLLQGPADPLRLAYAAARGPGELQATLVSRTPTANRRETVLWLTLFGRTDLAVALMPAAPDAGR